MSFYNILANQIKLTVCIKSLLFNVLPCVLYLAGYNSLNFILHVHEKRCAHARVFEVLFFSVASFEPPLE